MYQHARRVLEQISESLKEEFPADIVTIRAFGSRARGDHAGNSDFDVLVVVRKRMILLEERIIDRFVEFEMSSGISFEPLIKSSESFEQEKRHGTLFYQNVMNEGIPV